MEKEFVPYELAVKLKELGFNNKSLGFSYMKFNCEGVSNATFKKVVPNYLYNSYDLICTAPLWQQAFDWFREHLLLEGLILPQDKSALDPLPLYFIAIESYKNIDWVEIFNSTNESTLLHYSNYEDARQACLEKLIELCKKI